MHSTVTAIIIMAGGIIAAIALGIMASLAGQNKSKKLKAILAEELAKLDKLGFEELKALGEKEGRAKVKKDNKTFKRVINCNVFDCTGGKNAHDPYQELKVQVTVSTLDDSASEYDFIIRRKSTKKGLYDKGDS